MSLSIINRAVTSGKSFLRPSFSSSMIQSSIRFVQSQSSQLNSTWGEFLQETTRKQKETALSPQERWAQASETFLRKRLSPSDAYSGRSVEVRQGDVANAFRRVDAIMGRNRVWAELRRTERHERKGEKRRRLESERWRKRFKEEVRRKVQMVLEIRRRGA